MTKKRCLCISFLISRFLKVLNPLCYNYYRGTSLIAYIKILNKRGVFLDFTVDHSILLLSILLVIGVLTAKFSTRLGVPSLVLFIIVGMVVSHYIYFDNALLTQGFGILALIIILLMEACRPNGKMLNALFALPFH